MTPRTHLDFLTDIHAAARKAQTFAAGMSFEQFAADEKTAFAVVRALEIIGEAAKRIPEEIRAKSPRTPWRAMSGIRDKLIHDYISVDLAIVWKTVTEDLPTLVLQIERLIASANEKEKSPRPKRSARRKRKS